jgi:L-ascorbate metabolism protein UlaG (beta-lactamase superfamily)
MENGQYSNDWKFIHMMPEYLVKAIKDLNPRKIFTVHNSKYALSKHSWHEPLDNISNAVEQNSLNLITPMIGETVYLNDTTQIFKKWWLNIK